MSTQEWQVEGIWNTGKGPEVGNRLFNGTKEHVERVLTRLKNRGRLVQLNGVVSVANTIATKPERWSVKGVWKTPNGQCKDERIFIGSKSHIDKVLARLTVKGRLIRLEDYQRLKD